MAKTIPFLAAIALAGLSCSAAPPAKVAPDPSNVVRDNALAVERDVRKELIIPASILWTPQPVARKLALTIEAESRTIHVGDKLRYRVYLKNVGRENYSVYEDPSFLKNGAATSGSPFKFYIRYPDGQESPLAPPMLAFHRPAASSSRTDRSEPTELFATLASGETLTSRASPPGSGYRDLSTAYEFDAPGRYALRAVYSDGDSRVESNSLEFVVIK